MEEFSETYIGQDYPLDKDSLNRLSLNDDFLYQKICVESPRGIVLWKSKTSNTTLTPVGTAPTTISGFEFLWTPEANRVYKACFSFPYLTTASSPSGTGKYVIAIYLENESQNGYVSWYISENQTRAGFFLEAIIDGPQSVEQTISVKYETVSVLQNITLIGSSTAPTQFWVEDIGVSGKVSTIV